MKKPLAEVIKLKPRTQTNPQTNRNSSQDGYHHEIYRLNDRNWECGIKFPDMSEWMFLEEGSIKDCIKAIRDFKKEIREYETNPQIIAAVQIVCTITPEFAQTIYKTCYQTGKFKHRYWEIRSQLTPQQLQSMIESVDFD